MSPDSEKNFFDRGTLIAVVLIFLTFLGWQRYMQVKYPESLKSKAETEKTALKNSEEKLIEPKNEDAATANMKIPPLEPGDKSAGKATAPSRLNPPAALSRSESLISFSSENLAFQISSKGMGLKDVRILKFKDRKGQVIQLGKPGSVLQTQVRGASEPLDFELTKVSEMMFVGEAWFGDMQIKKTIEIDSSQYAIRTKIATSGRDPRFTGLMTRTTEEVEPLQQGSFFLPQFEKQEFFVEAGAATERLVFGGESLQKTWSSGRIGSVGSQYFAQAIVDRSSVLPEIRVRLNRENLSAEVVLDHSLLNPGEGLNLEYLGFLGPKSVSLLQSLDGGLTQLVDYGMFSSIGRFILSMMRWFHSWAGNWGLAIILLTSLVRIALLPLNLYSYKSMKALQAVQPKLQVIKERYKEDQQKQNQEVMRVMRESGANPLMGCLPMLLQFPIFLALYQVLGHSIELYRAPFALWIHDLSAKDPYFILPVLMGITMFIQFKVTPNTMDPAQAKVLLFMPILFTAFMLGLPSGLTLYMLVGSIFSIGQQMFFMKGSTSLKPSAKPA